MHLIPFTYTYNTNQIVFDYLKRHLVNLLKSRGTAIYLVSGGFQQLIEPVAQEIGISMEYVYANRLLFNEEGVFGTD